MAASLQSLGYLPVSTATLCAAAGLTFDLYLQRHGCGFGELYRGKNYPLTDEDLVKLCERGVSYLYVRLDEAESYRQYLHDHVLQETGISTPIRFRALREITRVAFEDAYRMGNCEPLVSVAESFGHDLAAMMSNCPPVFEELFKTLDHDYYTFTHACNVSTYCTVIANRMELFDVLEIAEIAAGALLHDIGKRHIAPHILNKSGKLDEREWNLMMEHPITGFRELSQRGDLSQGQLMMVYQHHERLDGSGYPTGVMGSEIHLWAKICAVADVFDAMTCKRPYRRAVAISEVNGFLRRLSGSQFETDVVECWVRPPEKASSSAG